ncbi:MAG TPA: alpha/beta fold hydrolase, partial [Dehalococcoidia bacterium]|nr:alpha/beta fold hydrolase [Dehalococcoidia bacterium]
MPLTEEATSKFVQAGNIRVHYNEAGTGYPLICLHGGGPGASGWSNYRGNIEPLSQHFRVFLPDLPGFGKTDKPMIEGGRFAFYAKTLRDFMDQLG